MEQRFHAVMECLNGVPKTEVAARYGVSRQSVYDWLARYRAEGVKGLEDRSHRAFTCPHRVDPEVEALVCELRRDHPRWGPRRLRFELGRRRVDPLPGRATVYRILRRNNLVAGVARKRRREDYRRWERPVPMELWQMDIVGGVMLADGTEAKVVTGVDDHSRFAVIATVVRRATGRAVCSAFASALVRFGAPGEVLTDNGKQFTGRFTKPRPGEVLFERICRENGIVARNTKPRTPTTTGKVERFHQTLQIECLDGRIFASVEEAQAAVDEFVREYNHDRPHQGIGDVFPAQRFHRPNPDRDRVECHAVLRIPAGLVATPPTPAPGRLVHSADAGSVIVAGRSQPVQVNKVVPPSGNLMIGRQQVWLGPARAGMPIVVWVDTDRLHVLTADGARIKSSPSRLSQRDLARLLADGGQPAGPSPLPDVAPERVAVEVDRVVNGCGGISISGHRISVGMPLAGQRIRVRLDGILLHVIDEAGQLRRTLRCPLTPTECARVRDGRPAAQLPPAVSQPEPGVERVVSINGNLQVAGQKIQVGKVHARKLVTVVLHEHTITVYDNDTPIKAVTRHSTTSLSRTKAHHRITA